MNDETDDSDHDTPISLAIRTVGDHISGTGESQCNNCAYRWPMTQYCDAFPNGIPPNVLMNKFIHNRPLPELGQLNKKVFALRGTVTDSLAEQMKQP